MEGYHEGRRNARITLVDDHINPCAVIEPSRCSRTQSNEATCMVGCRSEMFAGMPRMT